MRGLPGSMPWCHARWHGRAQAAGREITRRGNPQAPQRFEEQPLAANGDHLRFLGCSNRAPAPKDLLPLPPRLPTTRGVHNRVVVVGCSWDRARWRCGVPKSSFPTGGGQTATHSKRRATAGDSQLLLCPSFRPPSKSQRPWPPPVCCTGPKDLMWRIAPWLMPPTALVTRPLVVV